MRKEIEKLLINSQQYGDKIDSLPYLGEILSEWAEKKKNLLNGEIRITLPELIKIDTPAEAWQNKMMEWVKFDSADTINKDVAEEVYDFLVCNKGSNICTLDSWKNNRIPKGMKLTRALKYVIKNPDVLNSIQQKASTFIQEGKLQGYLTFSVHPIDFLTMSESDSGWHSCHSLDGDYRGGNMSYVLDNSTIVCFLSDKEPTCEKYGVPFYPKKWRVLLHANEDKTFAAINRQYPLACPELLQIVEEKASELFSLPETWCADPVDKKKMFLTDEWALLYNDLRKSPWYTQPIHTAIPLDKPVRPIVLGAKTPCPICGETNYRNETFFCDKCIEENELFHSGLNFICDCCDGMFWLEDMQTVLDKNEDTLDYCCDCAANYSWTCDCCKETFSNDVTMYSDDEQGLSLCKYCWKGLDAYRKR